MVKLCILYLIKWKPDQFSSSVFQLSLQSKRVRVARVIWQHSHVFWGIRGVGWDGQGVRGVDGVGGLESTCDAGII